MKPGDQRWRVETAFRGYCLVGFTFSVFVYHLGDLLQLNRMDDCSDVDALIQRIANAQIGHAVFQAGIKVFGNPFLHQEAGASAADLALIEPNGIDQTFNGAVDVGIFEDNVRGFSTQLQRQLFTGSSCGLSDDPANFR